jgi:hypothetical protein
MAGLVVYLTSAGLGAPYPFLLSLGASLATYVIGAFTGRSTVPSTLATRDPEPSN